MRRLAIVVFLAAGCRARALPPEPPGADAADPDGPVPAAPKPRAVDRSAFEGVDLGGGGHQHGHHGHKGGEK